jgi:hypothetical protein
MWTENDGQRLEIKQQNNKLCQGLGRRKVLKVGEPSQSSYEFEVNCTVEGWVYW